MAGTAGVVFLAFFVVLLVIALARDTLLLVFVLVTLVGLESQLGFESFNQFGLWSMRLSAQHLQCFS